MIDHLHIIAYMRYIIQVKEIKRISQITLRRNKDIRLYDTAVRDCKRVELFLALIQQLSGIIVHNAYIFHGRRNIYLVFSEKSTGNKIYIVKFEIIGTVS